MEPQVAKKQMKEKSYEVGRGKPPKHTQFGKGSTANKSNKVGRPKGSKNLATYLKEAANKPVKAMIDGKERTITALHATTMQLALAAAKGDQKSIKAFLDWIDKMETRQAAARPSQYPLSDADVQVIRAVYARLPPEKD